MRIGFYLASFPVVTETFILNQITGLIDRGHEVFIYAMVTKLPEKVHKDIIEYDLMAKTRQLMNVPESYLRRLFKAIWLLLKNYNSIKYQAVINSLNFFKYGRKALSLRLLYATICFLREKPDLMHCQFGNYGVHALLYKDIGALPDKLVVSFRGHDATKYLNNNPGVYKDLFTKGNLFLPVSKEIKKILINEGCSEKKIVIHRSGINLKKIKYSGTQIPKENDIKIITIARLVEMKGVEYSIRAVQKAIKRNRKIKYIIIGDGVLRAHLESLIKDLGIASCVQIIGWKNHDEVIEMIKKSNILVAPSVTASDGDKEGIPNVIKEAMAIGIPVISTYHSGIPELVKDSVTGFLVPERDVDAMAEKLEYLIDHPEIWKEFGKQGRKQVEDLFDMDKLNDDLVEIYENMLESLY